MSSADEHTAETWDPCDYILCDSNLRSTGNASEDVNLKKCAGCSMARYCSRDCQKNDWQSHKVWCHTHKAKGPEDGDNWRRLHRRLYAWRRTHFQTLKDAFLAVLDLHNNWKANHAFAVGLFVLYKPHNSAPTCLQIQRVQALSYESADAHSYAVARAEYEAQLAQRDPRAFYGAGMVVLRIRHAADAEGETSYAVPIPIKAAESSVTPKYDGLWLLEVNVPPGCH
ncbi:hypothetical protein EIP86_009266 [Pleurotus ostreatoroseus]|nr:hypothetical protein EIP86_009266 [Pleurotus ostreatoroseus]